jgi:hypothetical protein
VRIDIFVHRMTHRFRLHLEFWAIVLFVFPFCVLLFWFGYDFAERAFVRNEGPVGGMGLPNRWIIKAAIPLSAVLTSLGALSVALRIRVALARPDLLDDPFDRDDPPTPVGPVRRGRRADGNADRHPAGADVPRTDRGAVLVAAGGCRADGCDADLRGPRADAWAKCALRS